MTARRDSEVRRPLANSSCPRPVQFKVDTPDDHQLVGTIRTCPSSSSLRTVRTGMNDDGMNTKSIMTIPRQFIDEQLLDRSLVYTSRVLFQILYDLNRSPKSSISVALNLCRFPFDESPITVSMLNIQRPHMPFAGDDT